jgi:toxin ParE1/3/4
VRRYEISPEAFGDLDSISSYIAVDNLAAADLWLEETYGAFDMLSRFPHMGRNRPDVQRGARSFVRGNYVIFYRARKKNVVILRVFEGHRDIQDAEI